jgi:cytoskeletal protein CcmA (bactofilin family)
VRPVFQFADGSPMVWRHSPGGSDDSSPIQSPEVSIMFRMGTNPNEEKNQTEASTDSFSSRSYSPYQSGETYARPTIEAAATPKALIESETIARGIKDGTLNGFIASGASVTGDATFESMLRIDGHFSGRITSSSGLLIVGAGGQVNADVEVSVAKIQGIVNGDVIATQRIELGRAAKLSGNIQTPSLVIEQGAVFEGSCKMVQQKGVDKPAKVERKENVLDGASFQPTKPEAASKKTEDTSNKKPEIARVTAAAS